MIKKYTNTIRRIFPNKKTNIFVVIILFLGLISGAIFANIIGLNDKALVTDKIKLFIDNIHTNSIDSILAFKNSISINLIYLIIIFILGMTLIGIIFNIFILFIKSFIIGFTLASFIITHSYKGLILSASYLLLGQLLFIIVLILLTIYSITFSFKLLKVIFKSPNNNELPKYLKNYCLILILSIIISLLASLCEVFIFPSLIKLLINIFI